MPLPQGLHDVTLPGKLLLQVDEVANIGAAVRERYNGIDGALPKAALDRWWVLCSVRRLPAAKCNRRYARGHRLPACWHTNADVPALK